MTDPWKIRPSVRIDFYIWKIETSNLQFSNMTPFDHDRQKNLPWPHLDHPKRFRYRLPGWPPNYYKSKMPSNSSSMHHRRFDSWLVEFQPNPSNGQPSRPFHHNYPDRNGAQDLWANFIQSGHYRTAPENPKLWWYWQLHGNRLQPAHQLFQEPDRN